MTAKLVFVAFACFAFNAHAETSTSTMSTSSGSALSGFSIAAAYTNVTSVTGTSEGSFEDYSYSETTNSGTHLGMMGVRAAYDIQIGEIFSVEPGFAMVKRLNKSESEQDTTFWTVDTNLTWSATPALSIFVGPSITQIQVANTSTNIKPGLGAQIGLGYQIGHLIGKMGYTDYGYRSEYSSDYGSSRMSLRIGGFNAQIGYLF